MGCGIVFPPEGLEWGAPGWALVGLFLPCCVGISTGWASTYLTWLYFPEPRLSIPPATDEGNAEHRDQLQLVECHLSPLSSLPAGLAVFNTDANQKCPLNGPLAHSTVGLEALAWDSCGGFLHFLLLLSLVLHMSSMCPL